MKKYISLTLILIITFTLFSGCSNKGKPTDYKVANESLATGTIADNSEYSLSFDAQSNSISLLCKKSNKVWSNNPDNSGQATLSINVQDTRKGSNASFSDNESATSISVKKIKNGLEITYYFDEVKISVPVSYELRKDSVLVSIDGKNMQNADERYKLISVSPSSFLCSVPLENAEDSYLFVPYGVGGIIDAGLDADDLRKISVSDADVSSMSNESYTNSPESSGFRCFGVKDKTNALFAIAEETPGAIGYQMIAGDITKDYSYVSPIFYFADFDYFDGIAITDGTITQVADRYTGKVSMGFYPLFDEEANYMGMAKCYRNYLSENGFIELKDNVSSSPYSVTYLGGVMTTTSMLGVPVKTLKSMTTFGQAQEITSQLYNETGVMPIIRLSGYGETGVNIGEIAGGYKFASKLGSNKSRKSFEEYAKTNNSKLFYDFSLMKYSKSGNGFSYSNDAAKTAVLHAAEISPVNVALRDFNTYLTYRLLSRKNLSKAVDKLIKTADKKQLTSISLNDMGSLIYSDYGDGTKYAVAAEMENDVKAFLKKMKTAKLDVGVSAGTYFAAGLSDVIFDAPLEPSGRYAFATEVPFYQLVYHGLVPMYSSAINSAGDIDYKLMLAASTGTGLGFSLIKEYDVSYMETSPDKLYAMQYDGCKDTIVNSLNKYKQIYNDIANSKIVGYDILDNGVTKTTFENGKVIYANHTTTSVTTPAGQLGKYDFVMEGGVEE